MEALNINTNAEIVTNYNLDEEQEKKEIVRHYRALLRALREKLKKGDKFALKFTERYINDTIYDGVDNLEAMGENYCTTDVCEIKL